MLHDFVVRSDNNVHVFQDVFGDFGRLLVVEDLGEDVIVSVKTDFIEPLVDNTSRDNDQGCLGATLEILYDEVSMVYGVKKSVSESPDNRWTF